MNPDTTSSSNFFGIKISQPGIDIKNAAPNQLMYVNNYSQETFYGSNGNISFGLFTSGVTGQQTMGMQTLNSAGNPAFEMDGQTWYWFDNEGNVVMMVGYLPVAQVYGWAVASPGQSLAGVV